MKLHWLVFIIIGAFVLIVSLFKAELLFFRYVGGLFLIYGTFKLVFRLITGASSKKEALDMHSRYQQGQTQEQIQQRTFNNQKNNNHVYQRNNNYAYQKQNPQYNQNQPHNTQIRTIRCRCGNVVPITSNFCNKCGFRLR